MKYLYRLGESSESSELSEASDAKQQNTPSVEENQAVETLAAFFQGLF